MSLFLPARADRICAGLRLLGQSLVKEASLPKPSYAMSGMLFASTHKEKSWVLLSVPNALVRGVFDALDVPGAELPPSGEDGKLNAHISVFRPEEVKQIGGIDKIQERGHRFRYSLGRLVWVKPDGWTEMAKAYLITVHSPQLARLRRSYGLSSLPDGGEKPFHITTAVVRKGVLGRNEISKAVAA